MTIWFTHINAAVYTYISVVGPHTCVISSYATVSSSDIHAVVLKTEASVTGCYSLRISVLCKLLTGIGKAVIVIINKSSIMPIYRPFALPLYSRKLPRADGHVGAPQMYSDD